MADDPKRVALRKVAAYLAAEIRRAAPTAKSADSFHVRESGADFLIGSHDEGTIATELAWRHPVFGNRDVWRGPAGHQRGKRNFIERAADRAAQTAAEKFADEWAKQFVADTEWEIE